MIDAASPSKAKRKGAYCAGPGRPPGSKNKKTLALEEATRKAAASIDGAFEGDAHAFLAAIYRDPTVGAPGNPDHGRWAGTQGRETGAVGHTWAGGCPRRHCEEAGGGAQAGCVAAG
jgi:hypothetical protein